MADLKLLAISSFATVVSAVGVLIAAVYAAMSASSARKQMEASNVMRLLSDYRSPQMQESLAALRDHMLDVDGASYIEGLRHLSLSEICSTGQDFWSKDRNHKINVHRRDVHYYFKTATKLMTSNFLSAKSYRMVIDVNALDMYFDLIYPLTLIQHPEFQRAKPDIKKVAEDNDWVVTLRESACELGRLEPNRHDRCWDVY